VVADKIKPVTPVRATTHPGETRANIPTVPHVTVPIFPAVHHVVDWRGYLFPGFRDPLALVEWSRFVEPLTNTQNA
jgi:hypothetical protein